MEEISPCCADYIAGGYTVRVTINMPQMRMVTIRLMARILQYFVDISLVDIRIKEINPVKPVAMPKPEQGEVPLLEDEHQIVYDIAGGDQYLEDLRNQSN